ncbi:MAG: radical SAM protein, partial [Methanomicrobiaceae archaeon]|nr:radical SAM protein [Methanomicrobiaceae archaeon]
MTPEEKALLVSIGSARIDETLLAEVPGTKATAGPGAGGTSFFIRSGKRRVRLTVNRESPLSVVEGEGGVLVLRDGEVIARGILEPALCHCPEQAYITISERCIFDCRFCPVPMLHGEVKEISTVRGMVGEACSRGTLRAISLTSGVAVSPEHEVRRVAEVVRALREEYSLPIGVSVYPTESSSEILAAAGADEIKYNVETMDPAIFAQVCPGLSLPSILEALEGAVEIFGKNAVTSNFILGLGESDECVRKGTEELAERGVIPILRPISASPRRAGQVTVNRPSAGRLLRLARVQRDVLA